MDVLDDDSMIAIQMTIMGLTITEWMAKMREEFLTYDLVTAMAVDFFFAYDVIDFVMMLHNDYHVFQTDWMLVHVFEKESLTYAKCVEKKLSKLTTSKPFDCCHSCF